MEGRYSKRVWKSSAFCFLVCFLCLKRNVWCCLQIYEVYFCSIHLSSSRNFPQYFPENLSSYQWIYHPFVQAAPSSFVEQEKEDYIDLTCDKSLKRKIYSGNPANFWISLNNEHPALTKKRYGRLSLSLHRIYAKQDFLPWPWLKPNADHE